MSFPNEIQDKAAEFIRTRRIPLVIIVGPTAVGKSEIAIQVAEQLGGEIVSADSRTFYRGMDIGTAKPSLQDRERVLHHLIDIANPDEVLSLAVFQQQADRSIHHVFSNHHLPIMVGGTGQFIRAVTEGWKIPSVMPNPQLRQALEHWCDKIGAEILHSKLAIVDPSAAETIAYSNVRRTIRALEVIFSTGKRYSDQKQKGNQRYDSLLIGINRPRLELYARLDDRIDNMFANGLIEEVQQLLDLGYSPDLPTMSAIGYREVILYLQGAITLEEAKMIMRRRTRDFVRRQANWFKEDDPEIHWFQAGNITVDEIRKFILDWLATK
jgi:tRNA dimethylallyltransferase